MPARQKKSIALHRGSFAVIVLALVVFAGLAVARAARPAAEPSAQLLRDNELCLGCHSPTVRQETLSASVHQKLACTDCHQEVQSFPHQDTIGPVDCDRCHNLLPRQEFVGDRQEEPHKPLHYAATQRQAATMPDCTDCHGTHNVRAAFRQATAADQMTMVDTCGNCHAEIATEYRESIHGEALAAGHLDSPACSDCHPQHYRDAQETGRDVIRGEIVATCSSCHEDPGLQSRYALPAGRLVSYLGSYHGAASELGESRSANCASCHGNHHILPSGDPRSSIHRQNLAATCGQCHPNAGEHFASGTVHLQPSPQQDRAVFWVRTAYLLFILALMLAFLGYIGLDLLARINGRIRRPAPETTAPAEEPKEFERLTLNQRIQHWLLIASFTALIVTGLPLLFPKAELSQSVVNFLGGMGWRAIIHRVAAIILVGLCLYHLFYVLFSRRGYWEFRQLLPGIKDIKDVLHMLGFYFGLGQTRPRFHRYNYIEKFEYLAVGWGSVVMIGTGLLLWKPHLTLAYLPKWVMDIALVIHSWEAVLAFLAIVIWHMYNVHWNPSVFPMSRVWLTGRIEEEEFRENHPLEYEEYIAALAKKNRENQS